MSFRTRFEEGKGAAYPGPEGRAPAPEKWGGTANRPGSVGDADGWVHHPGGRACRHPKPYSPSRRTVSGEEAGGAYSAPSRVRERIRSSTASMASRSSGEEARARCSSR